MHQLKKIFIFIPLLWVCFIAAGAESDSIIIRNFEAGAYQATSINYTGAMDERGMAFFANESGVLEYDGSQWKLIPIRNFSPAVSLGTEGSRIYVGGRDEFGYLEPDSLGAYQYISLRSLLSLNEKESLGYMWQIEETAEGIYFQAPEMILRFDGKEVHKIPMEKEGYIFKIGDQLFTSVMNKGLAKVVQDSLVYVNTDFKFEKDMAFAFLKGLKGENLLLTPENGIYEINLATFKIKKWKNAVSELASKSSLYFGLNWGDSLYAFSTYKGGLILANAEGQVVQTFNKENGLISKSLRELFLDKRGNLWVTSDYGLAYLKKARGAKETPAFNTLIRSVSFEDKEVFIHKENRLLETIPDYAGSVVFHFATPGYQVEELEYSYFLEGFDRHWSTWQSDVKKEYTNLKGGSYTFHLKSRYNGVKESAPVTVNLIIPTPWYKTNSAYFLAAFFLSTLIVFVIHYRTKRLRLLNKRLAKIIHNRTKELVAQREQLRATNNELRIKNIELDNFVYRSSHDLVAPLKSLKGLISISQMEKEQANQEHYLKLMLTSVDKLESFIKSIMEFSSNTKKELLTQPVDLNEILDGILEDLKYYEKAERIEVMRNIPLNLSFHSDVKRLKIVLSNLITNSIKYHNYYQDYLFIELTAELVEEKFVKIEVKDNGRGIEPEYLGKIFDMFFRASSTAEGSGLGLYIVKDTVKKLGGEIAVSSDYGKGTVFSLLFPLNEPKASASAAE